MACLQGCATVYLEPPDPPPSTATATTSPAHPATEVVATAPASCAERSVPSPAGPCPREVDPEAVADCSAGYAALHLGLGYASLGSAIRAALPGDEVTVCPGTWPGGTVVDREVVITAADPTPGATVIDAAEGRGLEVRAPATIRGLTLRHGAASRSGSALLVEADGVVLECLTVEDNAGGAVAARGERLTVRASTFARNRAPLEGAALKASGGLVVEDCAFSENVAGYEGGAIAVRGDLTVSRSLFERNAADVRGGAIAWGDWDPFALDVSDSVFLCNASGGDGGAVDVAARSSDTATLERVTFAANFAAGSGGALGLSSWGALDVALVDVVFAGNASPDGGAVRFDGPLEGGVAAAIVRSAFADNLTERGGSALAFGSRPPFGSVVAERTSFLRNQGGDGAVGLAPRIRLSCTDCDLGAGADDNAPHDVVKPGAPETDVAGLGTFDL